MPNLKNLPPAFTKTEYDPGNKYSVAEGLRHHALLLEDRQDGLRRPKTIEECFGS